MSAQVGYLDKDFRVVLFFSNLKTMINRIRKTILNDAIVQFIVQYINECDETDCRFVDTTE